MKNIFSKILSFLKSTSDDGISIASQIDTYFERATNSANNGDYEDAIKQFIMY